MTEVDRGRKTKDESRRVSVQSGWRVTFRQDISFCPVSTVHTLLNGCKFLVSIFTQRSNITHWFPHVTPGPMRIWWLCLITSGGQAPASPICHHVNTSNSIIYHVYWPSHDNGSLTDSNTHPHAACCWSPLMADLPCGPCLSPDQYLLGMWRVTRSLSLLPTFLSSLLTHSSYLAANYRYMPGLAIIFITDYIPANRV